MAPLPLAAVSFLLPRVRFFRTALRFLLLATLLVGLFAALAFVPAVQTWLVERALSDLPGMRISVGSVGAGFSSARVTNLRLHNDFFDLVLPSLDAVLPISRALWDRQAQVGSLVAKGWTLDLSGQPSPDGKSPRHPTLSPRAVAERNHSAGAPAATTPTTTALARELPGLLSHLAFPCDLSLEDVDLEGEVVLPPLAGFASTRVHVVFKGGGMSSGHTGIFTLQISHAGIDPNKPGLNPIAQGRLSVAMATPRSVSQVDFAGRLASTAVSPTDEITVSVAIAGAALGQPESYSLSLIQNARRLVDLSAVLVGDQTRTVKGMWSVDLHDAELARFNLGPSSPGLATIGSGNFDADPTFDRVHAVGHTRTALSRLGNLTPALDRIGPASLESDFEVVRTGSNLHVDRINFAVVGTDPIATAHAVQSFDFDAQTGAVSTANPDADWLAGSLQQIPLAWFSGTFAGIEISGGNVSGDFAATINEGKFALRTTSPLVAAGVAVQHSGRALAQNLDLSLTLFAERNPAGWQIQAAPLILASAGRRLALIESKISPVAEPRVQQAISGKWNADLDAWATQPVLAGSGASFGQSSTGDFTIRVGHATEINVTAKHLGHTANRSVSTSVRAYLDAFGGVEFKVPLSISFDSSKSTLSVNGQWTRAKAGRRLEAELNGIEVDADHLRPIVTALAALSGVALPWLPTSQLSAASTNKDSQPFWGDWIGRTKLSVFLLRSGSNEWTNVSGNVLLERDSIRLESGRAMLTPASREPERINRPFAKAELTRNQLSADGLLKFDPVAEQPYRFESTVTIDRLDPSILFTVPGKSGEPIFEGRFALVAKIASQGRTLPELTAQPREEFHFLSKNGIVRLLKADVAPLLPENPTPVKDTLAKAGSLVGALFGVRKDAIDTGRNHLSKATEAVLDFGYQTPEIRYEDFALTAVRTAGGPLSLSEISINATNVHLSGTGEIGSVPDRPIRAQPLSLDLKIGFKGRSAQLLTTAGLLSAEKNEHGYTLLPQLIHIGGTLEKIDNSAWRDLLVKAATPTPRAEKKVR